MKLLAKYEPERCHSWWKRSGGRRLFGRVSWPRSARWVPVGRGVRSEPGVRYRRSYPIMAKPGSACLGLGCRNWQKSWMAAVRAWPGWPFCDQEPFDPFAASQWSRRDGWYPAADRPWMDSGQAGKRDIADHAAGLHAAVSDGIDVRARETHECRASFSAECEIMPPVPFDQGTGFAIPRPVRWPVFRLKRGWLTGNET
jgi:hypothetical protein